MNVINCIFLFNSYSEMKVDCSQFKIRNLKIDKAESKIFDKVIDGTKGNKYIVILLLTGYQYLPVKM